MDQAEAIQDDFVAEQAEPAMVESQDQVEEVVNDVEQVEANDTEAENESVEVEYVEIERNGIKYEVPKELESEMLMHSDYTKKTQSVAEKEKALEAQQAQFQQAVQAQQQNQQGHAQLAALGAQLNQYNGVNWSEFSQEDPQAAQTAFFEYTQLKDATQNLSQQLQHQEAVALQQQHVIHAKRLEQGKAELARDIPDWSPETAQKIISHGSEYGFSESELKQVADPRMVKVLNDARMYRQSLKKATATKPQETIKPATRVRGKSSGKKEPSKMNTEEFMKWRNKQTS